MKRFGNLFLVSLLSGVTTLGAYKLLFESDLMQKKLLLPGLCLALCLTGALATGTTPATTKASASHAQTEADGITPLMQAARTGQLGLMRQLIAQKAEVNARTSRNGTALMYAVDAGPAATAGMSQRPLLSNCPNSATRAMPLSSSTLRSDSQMPAPEVRMPITGANLSALIPAAKVSPSE